MLHSDNIFIQVRSRLLPLYDEGEATAIARLLLESCFGISYSDAYSGLYQPLSEEDRLRLNRLVNRLMDGEPIQYVTGTADFCGHQFYVAPGVLIPRVETEDLVRLVIQKVGQDKHLSIIDAGTGSGCIAISLKLALPQAKLTAVDLSDEALRQARLNAARLQADVKFVKADLLHPDKRILIPANVIVSNPPYVRESEKAEIHISVKNHEPKMALFVPDNHPLLFYEALADLGQRILPSGGYIFTEINSSLGKETCQLFEAKGFASVELFPDLMGKDRFVVCRK